MNRSNMFVVMLCGLLAVGSVHAAWYSPILRFGQSLKTQIVKYKKSSIAIASVAAAALGYFCFNKVRASKAAHAVVKAGDPIMIELKEVLSKRGTGQN